MSARHKCSRYEDDIEAQCFVAAHPDGAERGDVAAFFGLSGERVRQIEESALAKMREAMDAEPKVRVPRGATRETIRIRELLAKGVSTEAIAERVGVPAGRVYRSRAGMKAAS